MRPDAELSPAPRAVPVTLVVRALFGNFLSQFGWLFFAFGMLFVFVFDAGGGVLEWIRFRGDVITVRGEVVESEATNMSVNDVQVYRTDFAYTVGDGVQRTGSSFESGRWREVGATVEVEVLERDPDRARIAGMRGTPGGLGVVFIFVFPFVGGALGLWGFVSGLSVIRLMREGTLTSAELVGKETTGGRVNNQPVMKLTYVFQDEYGATHNVIAKSHDTARLEDEPRELILYDPRFPEKATVLDEMGAQPRVNPQGHLEATRHGIPTALYFLLPGASLLASVRYVLTLFG
ncbi:MAG: DUF3592 domain-containing protein [Gemmatimonadota bacterium]